MDGDKDIGYSSLEDLQDNPDRGGEQTPRMVMEAVLNRLRARAGCLDESFVSRLSTSLLGRMARRIFRDWDMARRAMANGQRTEMPDLMTLVTDELRRFGRRREVSEEYDRRNLRENLVDCELEEQRRRERGDYLRSPRRRQSLSQSYEFDPTLNLDHVQPVRYRSSPDSPVSPATGASDFEGHRSYQRTEKMRYRSHSKCYDDDLIREQRRLRHTRMSLENLAIGSSPRRTDPNRNDQISPEDVQHSVASDDSKDLPSNEDSIDLPTPEESLQGAEGGASPEDSNTPSEDLSASLEEQKLDTEGTGARNKDTQKERSKKRTRRIIEGLSTRQLVNLRNRSISRMDALEMLIQLSASLDRLDRLINGSRSRESAGEVVDMATLQEFFDSLETARSEEIANRVAAAEERSSDAVPGSSSSVPTVTENPVRDPRVDHD